MMAINYLSQVKLYESLSPKLAKSNLNRVVFVSSLINMVVSDDQLRQPFDTIYTNSAELYSITKAQQILYTKAAAKSPFQNFVVAVNPGLIYTDIMQHGDFYQKSIYYYQTPLFAALVPFIEPIINIIRYRLYERAPDGADRILYAALDMTLSNGDYIQNYGYINTAMLSAAADDFMINTLYDMTTEVIRV
eukprot:TRINITY_DN402_c0_g1_i4.p1 TRINITY_DN402_c0_g1~~TRINITY_DN402_c0_g1_i4.p1  ORF type:complete len:191 (-),score=30.20 TRINITY_DN402_c0_g1_i4:748-1320(-)